MMIRFVSMFSLVVLMACQGQGPRSDSDNLEQAYAQNFTGGTDTEGFRYTSFGPRSETRFLTEAKFQSDRAKLFAKKLSEARLLRLANSKGKIERLKISMKTENWGAVDFEGTIQRNRGETSALLKSPSVTDHEIKVVCTEGDCSTASAEIFAKGESDPQSAILFRRSERELRYRMDAVQLERTRNEAPAVVEKIDAFRKPQKVVVESAEIAHGPSQAAIYAVAPNNKGNGEKILETPLVSTDGRCRPLKESNAKYVFEKTCIVGNPTDGSGLVFKSKLPKGQSVFLELSHDPRRPPTLPKAATPRPTATGTTEITGLCPKLPVDRTHALVRQIFADCGHPLVQAQINQVWLKSTSRRGQAYDFLKLFRGWRSAGTGAKIPSDRKGTRANITSDDLGAMLDVFRKHDLPGLLTTIAVVESSLHTEACSPSGACGLWQFMPKTAQAFGLAPENRADVISSTEAAANYLKYLLKFWKDSKTGVPNMKLALASYNCGEGCIRRKTEQLEDHVQKQVAQDNEDYAHLDSIEEISEFSKDFWTLARYHMIPRETVGYVPAVLGLIFTSVSPQSYGLTEAPGSFDVLN